MIEQNYSIKCNANGEPYAVYKNVLNAEETRIRIQARLGSTDHVFHKNYLDEYSIPFYPLTADDQHRLEEHMEKWIFKLEYGLLNSPVGTPTVEKKYLMNDGAFVCSQLDPPKSNVDQNWELAGREVSLNMVLRNGPDGCLYINCDYVDVMDPSNGIDEPAVAAVVWDENVRHDDF